jgi:FkbM family methyltransferase
MIRSIAKSWPPKKKVIKFHRRILRFREWLTRLIHISDGQYDYRFRCETVGEFNRCLKFFTKEPGTVEWIDQNVKSGDIFYDIGANIGVYSILAASRTGRNGKVYAFEPQGANFARLIDNITANNLQQIVLPNNFALNDKEGFFPFHYSSSEVGTSGSQLSSNRDVSGDHNATRISELKYATTIDQLLAAGEIKAPQHIKIDVDGNETLILEGMSSLLSDTNCPLSIQVEMNDPHKDRILEFMKNHQYRLTRKHYTMSGARKIEEGCDLDALSYNAIFHHENCSYSHILKRTEPEIT